MGVTGFVVMAIGAGVGTSTRMGVRVAVAIWEANWDRHDGLVGFTTTFPLSECSQPSRNTSE